MGAGASRTGAHVKIRNAVGRGWVAARGSGRQGSASDADAQASAPPGQLRLLLILGGLTAVGPLSIDAYLPAFPEIATELRSSSSGVQLTLAACLFAMATGQLLVGPLSDSWGRRRPVLVALVCYLLASLACAVAPSVELLVLLRAVQGVAGGAGVVIARAVVRDVYSGSEVTRFLSRLMLVFGLAPIIAPSLGGLLLTVTGWRGIFVMLGALGVLLVVAVAIGLPETLPPERRRSPRLGAMVRTMIGLSGDRVFLGYALAQGLSFAGMFAYVSGSSFVVQEVYGASAQLYALLFGINALGLVLAAQVSGFLAGRVPERRTLLAALLLGVCAGAALVTVAASRAGGLVALAAALFVFVASLGLMLPNATSLALGRHPEAAGTGSALLGFVQTVIGAVVAPLIGLGPADSAVPMAAAVAGLAAAALLAELTLARRGPSR